MVMETDDAGGLKLRVQLAGKDRTLVIPQAQLDTARGIIRTVLREPFSRRPWYELFHLCVSGALAGFALDVTCATLGVGGALVVTFVGLFLIAAAVRMGRGFGGWYRGLAMGLLQEHIKEPDPFTARPGVLGWLQAALRDRAGWRAIGYCVLKVPLSLLSVLVAISVWVAALSCLTYPVTGTGYLAPGTFGIVRLVLHPGFYTVLSSSGFFHGLFIVVVGVVLFLLAPWSTRLFVYLDCGLMRALLGPDAVSARTRVLQQARSQTLESSAATLRRIERDLHDGTQAQLVAIAMRLGQAREALAPENEADLREVRRLVEEAHTGAKEAIVELRDLARGIHPPVLDTGLEGALATLAARSPIPTTVSVLMEDRPLPSLEAIAYFCVAELLANVAKHAQASEASVKCAQHGQWVRLVVRDDGLGGARPSPFGSTSSGLAGLSERARAVDGHLAIASPPGGPTVVTVDLPLST